MEMRNTRQVPSGPKEGEGPTLQQLMETIRNLQEANERFVFSVNFKLRVAANLKFYLS